MASSPRVRINAAGARAVLESPAVLADVEARAERIAAAACGMCSPDDDDDPFAASAMHGLNRARASVITATRHGRAAQNRRNVLIKAIGAGR